MEKTSFFILNTLIDLVFFLDIIITFRTSFIDYYGNVISKPRDIAMAYLKG